MGIPKFKLSGFFKLFKPEYVLGTTYTISFAFFESVVFPCIDRSKLKKCLILCDKKGFRKATSEAFALRSATREYLAAPAPCSGSFHPKVWMLLNQERFALLVGSGNLTQSGFIDNYELFEIYELGSGDAGLELANDAGRFLDGLANLWTGDSQLLAVDTLHEIRKALNSFSEDLQANPDGPRLVSSFDGHFTNALSKLSPAPDELHVASPFFGASLNGIQELKASVNPKQMHIFPAMHSGALVDLPVEDALEIDGVSIGVSKPLTKASRFPHLKLYGIRNGVDHWLFNSSVNCTHAALSGNNVEAGILRSVTETQYRDYFPRDYKSGVNAKGEVESDWQQSNWIMLWATDIGEQVVLTTHGQNKLPLTNVNLEMRVGGSRSSCKKDSLFETSHEVRLHWTQFGNLNRKTNAARVLRLTAVDAQGNEIQGVAFVDDLAALTSEPKHRGAWRAAAALLSLEGVPQFSDIAALFSLIEDVAFDDSEEEDEETARALPAGSTKENKKDKAAVWPPQPIEADVDLLIGSGSRSGHLHWFDRILASLLRKESGSSTVNSSSSDDPADDSVEAEVVDPKIVRVCERMWDHAFKEFCKVENALWSMEIDEKQSGRMWGPVTFMFLGVMAVRRAIVNPFPNEVEELEQWQPSKLIRDFVNLLFADRPQGDAYIPTASHVYYDDVFPPVAEDLGKRFEVFPGMEVTAILVLCMAHLHAVSRKVTQESFPLVPWLLLQQVGGDNVGHVVEDKAHMKNMWLRFFEDRQEGLLWDEVESSMAELFQIGWDHHEGYRMIANSKRAIAEGRYQVSEGSSGICFKSGCSSSGKVNPLNDRSFAALNVVVCESCGDIIVAERLFRAFEQRENYLG